MSSAVPASLGAGRRPLIVAIEGLDGTGKTTQAQRLSDALRTDGLEVDLRSFPRYESVFGSHIGALLAGDGADRLDPKTTALWFALDRFDAIKHSPLRGDVAVLNRFTLSNAVYQSARAVAVGSSDADEVFAFVVDLEERILGLARPDLTIFLDLDPAETMGRALTRAQAANSRPDAYERDTSLQDRVRGAYLGAVAAAPSRMVTVPCAAHGIVLGIEEIHSKVVDLVRNCRQDP